MNFNMKQAKRNSKTLRKKYIQSLVKREKEEELKVKKKLERKETKKNE